MRKTPRFSWLASLLAVATLLLPAAPSLAHPRSSAPYSLSVEDEWGRPLRTFHQGGETFVLGEYGTRYQLRVHNRTGRRVEAVITVDGRDAVSGEPGDFVAQRGYVIGAYDSVTVEGFRQNLDQVATFRFTHPGNSYSARMGSPQNVGVIGVALFPERHAPPPPALARPQPRAEYRGYGQGDYRDRSAHNDDGAGRASSRAKGSSAAPPASAPAARSMEAQSNRGGAPAGSSAADAYEGYAEEAPSRGNLGTEYGEARGSQVREVSFQRDDRRHPAQVIALRYDDAQGLVARGIELQPRPAMVQREPEPFPVNRFAAPPPY
jgi:hypothetical protein